MLKKALTAAVFCIAALGVTGCKDLKTPEGCATAYMEAILDGDIPEAFKITRIDRTVPKTDAERTALQIKTQVLARIYQDRHAEAEKLGGLKDIKIVKTEIKDNGTFAFVRMILIFGNRSTDNDHVFMIKHEDGNWIPVLRD